MGIEAPKFVAFILRFFDFFYFFSNKKAQRYVSSFFYILHIAEKVEKTVDSKKPVLG